jgi:hypothetical protein
MKYFINFSTPIMFIIYLIDLFDQWELNFGYMILKKLHFYIANLIYFNNNL